MSKQEYETLFLKDHTKRILFTINASTKTPIKATLENNLQTGQRKDQKIKQRINGSRSLKERDDYLSYTLGVTGIYLNKVNPVTETTMAVIELVRAKPVLLY